MKIRFAALSLVVAVLSASPSLADKTPQSGNIISMTSVDCGTKKQGKKTSTALLCQQYVVRTATTEYQIRQQKSGDQAILPANTPIQFTLDKDKMKFKVNGKKYEYIVVGASAITAK
jgi:hypothetical protein